MKRQYLHFSMEKIKLYNIFEITKKMCDEHEVIQNPSIEDIFDVDEQIRVKTREYIAKFWN